MENKQITIKEIYMELKNLENALQKKGIINKFELSAKDNEIIWDWPEQTTILAEDSLLAEDWLSQEDDESWKDL